ncbi:MAG: hypothetical protein K0Q74_656 [Gammaproteobacteria bacterium]|nr:hypothetical protein [Gammaproteobacteria bacterium]
MDSDRVQGQFMELKNELKEEWNRLTNSDLIQAGTGFGQQIEGCLQKKHRDLQNQAKKGANIFHCKQI